MEFMLHLYDSDTCRWTTKLVPLPVPERDRVLPVPDSATETLFHITTKVIMLGSTTIGWVDLWRGILFCNVLDEHPVLRDMPLPKPARCNRRTFCCGSPSPRRDITVVKPPEQQQLSTKYVEMGSYPRVEHSSPGSDEDSDDDASNIVHYWTATVWSMPVPIGSWNDWHKDCKIDVANIVVDNPRHCQLLLPPGSSIDLEKAKVTVRNLVTGHPTLGLGMDGHVAIYFFSKANRRADGGWLIAVGVRDSKLQGIAELDVRKHVFFKRYFCAAGISKYLINATGQAGTLVRSRFIRSK
ncbi:hypothetical protein BS78_06G188900 [Paspalum vaginatum]|nr:hypothetical protein BS78_06G188900 [Paspalum vaginatum]